MHRLALFSYESTSNRMTSFGLVEENMDLSRIQLAVRDGDSTGYLVLTG